MAYGLFLKYFLAFLTRVFQVQSQKVFNIVVPKFLLLLNSFKMLRRKNCKIHNIVFPPHIQSLLEEPCLQ